MKTIKIISFLLLIISCSSTQIVEKSPDIFFPNPPQKLELTDIPQDIKELIIERGMLLDKIKEYEDWMDFIKNIIDAQEKLKFLNNV